jgi:hypothetical protein
MDAFQFLRAEHRKASELLKRLRDAVNAAERERLFAELQQELESDAAVEKEYFYPPLLQRQATADIADGGLNDLNRLHELLVRLEALPREGGEWHACLDQLQQAMDEHMHKEEETLFRRARGVLSPPLREDLGERMRAHKLRLIEGGAQTRTEQRQEQRGAAEPGSTAEDLSRYARERSRGFVESQTRYLTGQVEGLSRAVRQTADNLRQQSDQADLSIYLQHAAGRLDRFTDTLREDGVEGLLARTSDLARRQPALFMSGAVMAGFLLARFLKSSEKGVTAGSRR